MRIGYGYRRSDKDFEPWDCDRVFIDVPATERAARRDLFLCLQPGDTVFMLKRGDLGHGVELKNLRQMLTDNGITLEYAPDAPVTRGRPAVFEPSPEDDRYIRALWKDQTVSPGYVLRIAREKTDANVQRHHLIYRYGKRKR